MTEPSKSVLVYLASLLVALGAWASALPMEVTWAALFTVQNIFSLLAIIGSVTLAWLGKSPLNNGKQ